MKLLCLCLLLIYLPYTSFSQSDYNFYISNSGSDLNSGTSASMPRKTLKATSDSINKFGRLNGKVGVGLLAGNVFNESLTSSYPLRIGTYDSQNSHGFAILNGSDAFDTGWLKVQGTSFIYRQNINSKDFGGTPIGGYSYILVIEIDKELEKMAPFTARRPLKFVMGYDLEATPGSFYEPVTTDTSITIYLHTSNDISPNVNSKYRYEVTVRNRGVDGYRNNNNRFENLWVRGYGAGYGLIPSGANTYCNKIVFGPAAAIHHIVLKNGIINNSLFLPTSKNIGSYAVVFYDVEGFQRHNKISNTIFLDVLQPVYTHTSYGSHHGALELENVIAFGESPEAGGFAGTSDNDTVLFNKVYIDNFNSGYYIGNNNTSAQYSKIQNSYFKNVSKGIAYGSNNINSYVENVFMCLSGKGNVFGVSMQGNTTLSLSNSTLHIKNNSSGTSAGRFITGSGQATNHISATKNIFICDIDPSQSVIAATVNTNNGMGTSSDVWDNNVYILLKGNNILWSVTNSATNSGSAAVKTFEEWKKQSGQDQNSLFFDLRNDPRGLQAIFIDPDNGNYELANTVEGNQVKALHAGMTTPIACFLKKPSYEEAADLIKNNKTLTINSCRYTCQQTNVQLASSTPPLAHGVIGICANQDQVFKASGTYTQNDSYYHQSDKTARYFWLFSNGRDTSGVGLNSVIHRFDEGSETSIKLQIVDENGCSTEKFFTGSEQNLPVFDLGKDTAVCKGFDVTFSANYPGARYLWNNGSTGNSITVKNQGTYWLQTTLNGCSFRDSIQLKLENCPCTVQMPNAFSPNNDGVNDLYTPVLGCLPTTFDLSVYNSWGQLVFNTKNYKNHWDGRFNGKLLPSGVYLYILKTNNETLQKVQQFRGSILLFR